MRHLLFITLIFSLFSSAHAWESDYAQAVEKSHEDQKPLLLFFTGSDWSGLSMKMKNEVLDSSLFQEKIGAHFRCLVIDFPKHTSLPNQLAEQNQRLKHQFGVEEYPLLLLLDPHEREIVRFGYIPESGERLANELLCARAQDAELTRGLNNFPEEEDRLRHLYQLGQLLSRQEAQERILAVGVKREIPFFLLEKYRLLIEEGKEAKELREKLLENNDYQVHFSMAMIDFQERASTLHDPREIIKPLEAYLERFGDQDEQNVWRIEMMIAQFYLDADEWKTALEHAETAYEAAPTNVQSEIKNSLIYIRDQIR